MTELTSIARTRAFIVHPSVKTKPYTGALNGELERHRSAESRLEETVNLADAIELDVVDGFVVPISEIRPSTYIGSGKLDEIGLRAKEAEIDLVVMDCTPTLEKAPRQLPTAGKN